MGVEQERKPWKTSGRYMTATNTTRTISGNLVSDCVFKGSRSVGARKVIVASDNRSVQDWLYRYLEPYEARAYAFCFVEREADFSDYLGKSETAIAFVEDIFFDEKTMGKLDCMRKQYPKLRLVLFSASHLPLGVAARYVCWSLGSYISLRDREKEIKAVVDAVFGKRQAVPSYLIDCIDRYSRLPGIEPHLTHREIEIIRCAVEGKTAKETASVLMLSQKTVQNHITNIYEKFGIHNMVGVLKLAVSKGILSVDELMDLIG